MALTRRLDEMRDDVRYTADVIAFTDRHPNARINSLINQGLGALSRVCRTTNPRFQPVASSIIATDGNNTSYSLPSNFRSLLMVEYLTDDSVKDWLLPHEMYERAKLTEAHTVSAATRATSYAVLGTNLELLPLAPADHTVTVWYATTMTQLASDSQTFDTMDRLDSYVVWWAAREIAMEREAWERYDRLSSRLAELEGDIRILARSIDLSSPSRVVDLDEAQRGRRRWR